MATGFTQRWKGKVTAASLWLGGQQTYGSGAAVAYTTASTNATAIPNISGIATLTATTAISVFGLSFLPSPGAEFSIAVISVSSGVFVKAAAGSSFDPSTNTVFKSTQVQTITLIGLSSAKWAIKSVFPGSSLGSALISGLTLSTTT